jgi:hypothetical protein
MLRQALNEYESLHSRKPSAILLTPHAALAMSAMMSSRGERLTGVIEGVPLTCDLFDGNDAVPAGTGSRLGFFVRDSGVQQHVAIVELR